MPLIKNLTKEHFTRRYKQVTHSIASKLLFTRKRKEFTIPSPLPIPDTTDTDVLKKEKEIPIDLRYSYDTNSFTSTLFLPDEDDCSTYGSVMSEEDILQEYPQHFETKYLNSYAKLPNRDWPIYDRSRDRVVVNKKSHKS